MTELNKDLQTARHNRATWDAQASEYQEMHEESLSDDLAFAWGIWRTSEDELKVLGVVRDKDILELGCGAAQWAIALAKRGARAVGLDNSGRQLAHARTLVQREGLHVPLVQSPAETVPFPDASFDIVLSDYGATHFADPYEVIPECSRVLRTGGVLAFSTTGPLLQLCWDNEGDHVTSELQQTYFGMHRFEWSEDEPVDFNLPYGEWIRLFRSNGLAVEDLMEIRPPEDAKTTYEGRPLWWARRWPAEIIWKVRKET
ncbi:MAG: methyltransferase domain-containing protein [Actinomycetota bacterium]|nr:methyltransferase domain-containing protein [Actinomycetota bacterium]